MAYVITDECAGCGTCANTCPVGCIDSSTTPFVINQDECAWCGQCLAACPIGAISNN